MTQPQYDFLSQPPDSTYERQENILTPASIPSLGETPPASDIQQFAEEVFPNSRRFTAAEQTEYNAAVEKLYEPAPASASLKERADALERVFIAAQRFCAELQEDADGVPQQELRELHAALDEVEA